MKKETLMKIFENNKTTNFCISTSNATGRGINGVSFDDYTGCLMTKNEYSDGYHITETTKILGFMEDCLVLEVNKPCNNYWAGGTHTVYLPYNTITCVDFVTEDRKCYPKKLSFRHKLVEL
jgi:hypothetical protein